MSAESGRRDFLLSGSGMVVGSLLSGGRHALGQESEHEGHDASEPVGNSEYPRERPGAGGPPGSDTYLGKLVPGYRAAGEPPTPIEAPDLTSLFWEMKDGVKEFHLYAQPVKREFLPDMYFDVWGFNGSMPGPTIEAVEGDRVRIVVHNELPESTVIHWHGLEVPNRFDGVHGLLQDPIPPGESYVYEFDLHQNGTFFYHSHGPMQESMGMVGLFIIYPKEAHAPAVDKDFVLVIQEFAVLPMSSVPNTMSMEFNFFTINGRSGPYTTPLVAKLGDRVRIRFLNFSGIDHHPMHMHGHTFWVTGTEGGRIPESAWIPGNNVLVGVAQVREIEFIANNPGDWMIHCHMFHHMMNHMTSMVGPMAMQMDHGGHSMSSSGSRSGGAKDRGEMARAQPAELPVGLEMAQSMGMLGRGPALSEENGPAFGRGMGEQTGQERATRNGPMTAQHLSGQHEGMEHGEPMTMPEHTNHASHGGNQARSVPGFPQDMMDMHGMYKPDEVAKINKPQTRGMRSQWYTGVEALMTVIRVLPPDLYEKVISGEGEIPPGASVPGAENGHGHSHEPERD